jgi:hypothetical protein
MDPPFPAKPDAGSTPLAKLVNLDRTDSLTTAHCGAKAEFRKKVFICTECLACGRFRVEGSQPTGDSSTWSRFLELSGLPVDASHSQEWQSAVKRTVHTSVFFSVVGTETRGWSWAWAAARCRS